MSIELSGNDLIGLVVMVTAMNGFTLLRIRNILQEIKEENEKK